MVLSDFNRARSGSGENPSARWMVDWVCRVNLPAHKHQECVVGGDAPGVVSSSGWHQQDFSFNEFYLVFWSQDGRRDHEAVVRGAEGVSGAVGFRRPGGWCWLGCGHCSGCLHLDWGRVSCSAMIVGSGGPVQAS